LQRATKTVGTTQRCEPQWHRMRRMERPGITIIRRLIVVIAALRTTWANMPFWSPGSTTFHHSRMERPGIAAVARGCACIAPLGSLSTGTRSMSGTHTASGSAAAHASAHNSCLNDPVCECPTGPVIALAGLPSGHRQSTGACATTGHPAAADHVTAPALRHQ